MQGLKPIVVHRANLFICPWCEALHETFKGAAACCAEGIDEISAYVCPVCGSHHAHLKDLCCRPERLEASLKLARTSEGRYGCGIAEMKERLERAKKLDWDNITVEE